MKENRLFYLTADFEDGPGECGSGGGSYTEYATSLEEVILKVLKSFGRSSPEEIRARDSVTGESLQCNQQEIAALLAADHMGIVKIESKRSEVIKELNGTIFIPEEPVAQEDVTLSSAMELLRSISSILHERHIGQHTASVWQRRLDDHERLDDMEFSVDDWLDKYDAGV